MRLPPAPGVYVVELLNDDPISVNADRRAIADQCIFVNRMNCKFGQAVNLARRQRNYERTFGAQNVKFIYFHETSNYFEIEQLAKARLNQYRITGRTGRPTEWLHGVSALEVGNLIQQLAQSIQSASISTQITRKTSHINLPIEKSVRSAGASPRQIVDAAEYLASQEMHVELLRELHHSPRRTETFRSTIAYFSKKSDIRDRNIIYGARLAYVANEHQNSGRAFEILIKEALQRYSTDA
jgi:hypothetical protein